MARSTRAVWYELQGRYEFNSKSCDNEETVILAPFKRARVERLSETFLYHSRTLLGRQS